ncbi:MAG: hypothetical protein AAF902_05160 [Chloroflexota bacterium]
MNKLPLANYHSEQEMFRSLLTPSANQSILLFQGESGSGKSHLIDHCLQLFRAQTAAHMRLENSTEAIGTLLNILGSKLGLKQLQVFNETVSGLLGEQPEQNEALWPMKLRRHLREIGRASDLSTRQEHFQLLADSLFTDTAQLKEPIIVAIDTYEKCSTEFDQWFTQEFLYGVAHTQNLKVVVAGQAVPQPLPDWESKAILHKLEGVPDVHAWEVWGELLDLKLPSADVITGICLALQGNPSAIVETLKSQFTATSLKESVAPNVGNQAMLAYNQRKRMRENIIKGFSLNELKDLCFDLNIEYENLPDHDHKPGLARELVGYLGRDGRLEEFLAICQAERPELVWMV